MLGASFLRLRRDEFCEDMTVGWSNVCVVVLDGFSDFKSKFLVEIDGIFIVSLDMQVNLGNILLGAEIENMIQQSSTCNLVEN